MKNNKQIQLNKMFQCMHGNNENYIDVYSRKGKSRKYYSDLYNDIQNAAIILIQKGVNKGDRIGLIGSSSYSLIVADLACIYIGAFTTHLDRNNIYDLDDLVSRYEISLLITDIQRYLSARKFVIDSEQLLNTPNTNLVIQPVVHSGNDTFTMTFTSGTNGRKKAIEVNVNCFEDQFSSANLLFDLTSDDKILIFLPLNIYLERCYIYFALIKGFNVVVTPVEYVLKAIKNDQITFTIGVPYFFETLVDLYLLQMQSNRMHKFRYKLYLLVKKLGLGFITKKPFGPFTQFWGGNIKFLLTGSSPCKYHILQFYQNMGINLYEGYGMGEIANMVSLNYPGNIKIGSVGKIFPNRKIKLDSSGQIYVAGGDLAEHRYFKEKKEVNNITYLDDGWIATGDIGHVDNEGYLYLDGRLKEFIALSNGIKINPTYIEEKLYHSDIIKDCIVIGENRPYLIVLIALKDKSIDIRRIKETLSKINLELPLDERIRKYHLIDETFSADNGMLTDSYKLNRSYICERYRKVIEAIYGSQ